MPAEKVHVVTSNSPWRQGLRIKLKKAKTISIAQKYLMSLDVYRLIVDTDKMFVMVTVSVFNHQCIFTSG